MPAYRTFCVPKLPEDPAEYLLFLRILNLFETASFTEEDEQRTNNTKKKQKGIYCSGALKMTSSMYQLRAIRKKIQSASAPTQIILPIPLQLQGAEKRYGKLYLKYHCISCRCQ